MKQAEALFEEGLKKAGLVASELEKTASCDLRKMAIRSETTASLGWLAERLKMRNDAKVSQILRSAKLSSLSRMSRYAA